MRPPHDEDRPSVHAEGAEGLRRSPRQFSRMVQDGFCAPDAHFGVEAAGGDSRAVGVDMAGEDRDTLVVRAHGGIWVPDVPGCSG